MNISMKNMIRPVRENSKYDIPAKNSFSHIDHVTDRYFNQGWSKFFTRWKGTNRLKPVKKNKETDLKHSGIVAGLGWEAVHHIGLITSDTERQLFG